MCDRRFRACASDYNPRAITVAHTVAFN